MKSLLLGVVLVAWSVGTSHGQNMVERALGDTYFDWKSVNSDVARVYYKSGSFAERHREMLLRSVAVTIEEDLRFLGETEYAPVLNVFYVDNRSEMERIVGSPVTGFANWSADAIFLVCSPDWRSFEKHEFAHIITMGMWGTPQVTSRWMIEGIAIAADGWCREYSVDEIARHYHRQGELPPLEILPAKIRELGEIRGGIYAASVLAFIRNNYGPGAVRELWKSGFNGGLTKLGVTPGKLDESWRKYLETTIEGERPIDVEKINDSGCG